ARCGREPRACVQGRSALPRNLAWMSLTLQSESAVRVAGARVAGAALLCACAFALALAACGSIHSVQDADARLDARVAAPASSPATEAAPRADLAATVRAARRAYKRETGGSKLRREADRIARDGILLSALAGGDVAAAQAEADAQLRSAANHLDHVTRISALRGGRVLVNATLNSDGRFVVAPARRDLRLRGRRV